MENLSLDWVRTGINLLGHLLPHTEAYEVWKLRMTLEKCLSWQVLKKTHQMQAHVAINTQTHKQMSQKHAFHTLRDMHTYILWQHAWSTRVASCQRSLGEENATCPLIFPTRAKSDSPPTGATSIFSLIPSLIAACLLFSIQQCITDFVVPSQLSVCAYDLSKRQFLCNYFKSHWYLELW